MKNLVENLVPGFYIGKATDNGGLVLYLAKKAEKIGPHTTDESLPLPFSESGFCSQEEMENYYKKQPMP